MNYKCPECGKVLETKKGLYGHRRITHGVVKKAVYGSGVDDIQKNIRKMSASMEMYSKTFAHIGQAVAKNAQLSGDLYKKVAGDFLVVTSRIDNFAKKMDSSLDVFRNAADRIAVFQERNKALANWFEGLGVSDQIEVLQNTMDDMKVKFGGMARSRDITIMTRVNSRLRKELEEVQSTLSYLGGQLAYLSGKHKIPGSSGQEHLSTSKFEGHKIPESDGQEHLK